MRWMKLEPVIQSEVSQKKQLHINAYIWIQKDSTDEFLCRAALETREHTSGHSRGRARQDKLRGQHKSIRITMYVTDSWWEFAYDSGSSNQCSLITQTGGMGWEVGERFKIEGTYVCLCLIHVATWQEPTQYCKAITVQLKLLFLKPGLEMYMLSDSSYMNLKISMTFKIRQSSL